MKDIILRDSMKKSRSFIPFSTILVLVIFIISYNLYQSRQQHNKLGAISKNDIVSFKIHNIKVEEKEIKSKTERDKIIDLINGFSIIQTGVEPLDGIGYGIAITYSNGEKFSASFMNSTDGNRMVYSTDDNGIWCNVDKSIVEDLRKFYDNN